MYRSPSQPSGLNMGSGPNQQFFDSSVGNLSQQQGYPVLGAAPLQSAYAFPSSSGGSAGSLPSTAAITTVIPMAGLSGGSAPLTFTPSGTAGPAVPPFKNVRTTVKNLTDHYQNILASTFKADAAFLHNYMADFDRLSKISENPASAQLLDKKPQIEPEVKPDAEVLALVEDLSAINGFRQTSNQASWTAKYLPQTATSHFDGDFELPQSLDNPTLQEIQQTALDQINYIKRYRKAFADCISGMAKSVEAPLDEEIAEFFKAEMYRQ